MYGRSPYGKGNYFWFLLLWDPRDNWIWSCKSEIMTSCQWEVKQIYSHIVDSDLKMIRGEYLPWNKCDLVSIRGLFLLNRLENFLLSITTLVEIKSHILILQILLYHRNTEFHYKSALGRVLGKALEEEKRHKHTNSIRGQEWWVAWQAVWVKFSFIREQWECSHLETRKGFSKTMIFQLVFNDEKRRLRETRNYRWRTEK